MPITQAELNASLTGPSALAVVYNPDTTTPSPNDRATVLIPLNALQNVGPSAWKPLPLLARLGISMQFLTSREAGSAAGAALAIFKVETGRNVALEVLTTECDPSSDHFGKAGYEVDGAVMFKYADEEGRLGQQPKPVECLELFIAERLKAIKAALAAGGEDVGMEKAKAEYAKLNPWEFKKFFKVWRAEKAKEFPGMGWKSIECPVQMDEEACEGCGARAGDVVKRNGEESDEEKETKMELKRCVGCSGKKVMYCGKECQREDWPAHKAFCHGAWRPARGVGKTGCGA